MIKPLPIDAQEAKLPVTFDPGNSESTWVMAAGTTLAHVHVHFTEEATEALMRIPTE
jgi:uncharacterized protein (DUF849 family)